MLPHFRDEEMEAAEFYGPEIPTSPVAFCLSLPSPRGPSYFAFVFILSYCLSAFLYVSWIR